MKVDAVVLDDNGKAYFFQGSEYTKYDLETFQPDPGYPLPIAGNWPGLWEQNIDAGTNWGSSGQAFFFKGSEYTGYTLKTDQADDPKPIAGNWSGVWDSDIDAAVDWGNGKLYFFKGNEYTKYDIANDQADEGYPKPIEGNWPGLWSEGVDAVVNWGNGKAYFFRGAEYICYDIEADKADSGYPKTISEGWPPSSATTGELSAERQEMLDLINKWMPTSLLQPRVPAGEKQDLLGRAGWTKTTGQTNKKVKDDGGHPATSCGDVLQAMLVLWRSNFLGAFGIRDVGIKNGPGAKKLGYYVEADGIKSPKPGDIIVLRSGFGRGSAGTAGHVGILVDASATVWRTADGGGGQLPDQTAKVTDRTVRFENNIPILKSPTDGKEKQLDGWVDLDKLTQTSSK